MEPIKVPPVPSKSVEHRSSSFYLRKLWQVPVFFVGTVAVLTAVLTRGYLARDPVHQLHHHLAETRRLLERDANDPDSSLLHAQQAVDDLGFDEGRAAEAFFLLGSAHIQVADRTNSAGGGGEEATLEHWREARRCLQEAERRGLAGEDSSRLHYRLAKVSFHLGDDPRQVIELLKTNMENADNRAEALMLLSQAYLRLTPPNLQEALKANKKLREEVPQIGEDVLGPAKLAGAKLLLQLNQRDEARRTLEKIGDRAAPAVLAEKNMLLAGLYQEEHKWTEAAALWRAVLEEKRVPLAEIGAVLYNLGVCCRQLDQNAAAAEAWNDCMRRSRGEEGQAAALELAELSLHEANADKSLTLLAQAVAKVRKADDWKNSLVGLAKVRDLFEQAMTIYRQDKRFDQAVRTAERYERVAVPPKAQLRRAELNTEWAKSVQERAKLVKDEAARKKEEATADELLRQAAEAHTEAAKLLSDKNECEEHLWLSAVCSYQGHDYSRAADKLREIVEREKDNVDRQSEGLFLLGETCRQLRDLKAAEAAYRACVLCGARFTYRARYQIALMDIEAKSIDLATNELEQNILIDHRDSDPEAQEKSRLALCHLYYERAATLSQNYSKVIHYLDRHLDHLALTPDSVRARYQLADSFRQQASHDALNRNANNLSDQMSREAADHFLELNKQYWTRAAQEFAKVEEFIKEPELASLLSLKQQVEVPFNVAECYFHLGEYEKALRKYEDLAKKWGHSQHALLALGETIRCYGGLSDYTRLRQRAQEIRDRLMATEGLSPNDRQQWIAWLNEAEKVPPDRSSNSDPDQPRIISPSREGSRMTNDHGPIFDSQRR